MSTCAQKATRDLPAAIVFPFLMRKFKPMYSAEPGAYERARHRLAPMFEPRSVALVGASDGSLWSRLIHRNFGDLGFDGALYAVNRGGAPAHGLQGFTSCAAIGRALDLAFLYVPKTAMIAALQDAAAAGARNVVILTSGYAETGTAGQADQRILLETADRLGISLWGPNSLGFVNFSHRIPMSAIPVVDPILPASIAIVSQSGATASELYEYAHSQNIGLSFVAATGNEGRISIADVIDYLIDHDGTRAIAVFAEMIRDPDGFARAAERARAAAKPIVMLKVGRSALATAVAQAHTGSLVGDDKVFQAVCARLGVIYVTSAEDLIDTAALLASTGPLPACGLGFVSISGGACTLVADGAEAAGVSLPAPSPELCGELLAALPEFGAALNPLDVTGAAMRDPDLFDRVIPIAAKGDDIGLVAISMTIPTVAGQGVPDALRAIGRAVARLDKPAVMISTCSKSLTNVSREAIADAGLPHVMTGIAGSLRAIGKAGWWSRQLQRKPLPRSTHQSEASLAGRLVTERDVLDYLSDQGVPVIPGYVVDTARAAANAADTLGGRVVLKILSPDIAHKTEAGGVRLNVAPGTASAAFDSIIADALRFAPTARVDGVIVSPMRGTGIELLVGITRDPNWGLMLTFGFGGVMVDLLADIAVTPLPVSTQEVIEMLASLRGARLLGGFRGAPAADLDAIAQAIVAIGEAASRLGPELASLEVNPLLVAGNRVEALDALISWN